MIERRRHPRLRTFLGAKIVFNHRWSVIDGLVRNLSTGGARVEFTNTAVVPDTFDLVIPRRDETHRVRVLWRAQDAAGVALEAPRAPVSLEQGRSIRDLEKELVRLRTRNAELEHMP